MITLQEAKAHCKIPASDTSNDTKLQGFIDAAAVKIEHVTGPVLGKTYTENHDGGLSYIELRHAPIRTVTSVTMFIGTSSYALTVQTTPNVAGPYNCVVDYDTGRIVRYSSGVETPFPDGRGSVQVVYATGRDPIPANITLACKELVRHWFQQTQQGGRPSFQGTGAADDTVSAMTIPARVMQMLTPRAPSVA